MGTNEPLVMVLRGTLNASESTALEQDLIKRLERTPAPVILHCEGLHYLNSHAAGILVHAQQLLARCNMGLHLLAPPPTILYILECAGLAAILEIHETEDDARAAISRGTKQP